MRPQIVLELSGNASGSFEACLDLITVGKIFGCPVKFQRFDPARLAKRRTGISWFGKPRTESFLLGLYRETETPVTWWPDILEALGNHPWSCSVFDQRDIDFMEGLDCPAYKIASYEMSDPTLIAAAARTKKPLTVSIPRRASPDQIKAAVKATSKAPVRHSSMPLTIFKPGTIISVTLLTRSRAIGGRGRMLRRRSDCRIIRRPAARCSPTMPCNGAHQ